MPTKREREYYAMGFRDGVAQAHPSDRIISPSLLRELEKPYESQYLGRDPRPKPKRKLSAWQRYIKNKRNHITYRDGKLNLKAMGVQYRKKKRR